MNTKKVMINVLDTKTGICQHGIIEEPVMAGKEIQNAIKHFVATDSINWKHEDSSDAYITKFGEIIDTSKVVTAILIK